MELDIYYRVSDLPDLDIEDSKWLCDSCLSELSNNIDYNIVDRSSDYDCECAECDNSNAELWYRLSGEEY